VSPVQVLLSRSEEAPVVAGLPSSVRAAYRAGKELSPERIVVSGADAPFLKQWEFQFAAAGAPVRESLEPSLPVLAVAADAFPDERGLADFVAAAAPLGAARRVVAGRTVAVYASAPPSASPAQAHSALLSTTPAEVSAGAFFDASTPSTADAARRVLYSRMSKDNDGYIARFDRVLSLALTTMMLPFPISPNQVTAVSLAVGLMGAVWLAAPSQLWQFIGALTLWLCALLDGCDGEIARLKHHITPHGGDFDLLADHIAHLATFIALPIGVARLHPGTDWWLPGTLLVSGFLACGFSVWYLVLRVPEDQRGPLAVVVERIASRDYVYLIVLCTALGHLDWFVWAAAVGSHVFWLWLWSSSRRSTTEVA
jgi:phosphatidylglycerophosphate synthase